MITLLLLVAFPPPSEATLARYSRPKVYPRYVYRVWTADWCETCQSAEWKATIKKLDAIPGVGIQYKSFDRFRVYALRRKITILPTVELYEVRDGRLVRVVGTLRGRQPFWRLKGMLP
jgi:hypothetical protein